jgi:3-dehydroquinate dehydratase-1
MKPIQLDPNSGGAGRMPLVCIPLVARGAGALLQEAAAAAAKGPDLLEWRVDFFEGVARSGEVVALAARIAQAAGGLPLLFTRRCPREGGESNGLSERQAVDLYSAVCSARAAQMIDFEMGNDPAHVRELREVSRSNGVRMVMSFHDFQGTPALEVLNRHFLQAEQLGADIAKVAVMPRGMQDVLTLLTATWQSSQRLSIPLVSMAMGAEGALTRLCGWAFGSAMTFGAGQLGSAPGQLPVDELQAGLALLRKAAGR